MILTVRKYRKVSPIFLFLLTSADISLDNIFQNIVIFREFLRQFEKKKLFFEVFNEIFRIFQVLKGDYVDFIN